MDMELLDHQLTGDELRWVKGVYDDFAATRAAYSDPKEALREVLGRPEHALPGPTDLSGDGPWRLGSNGHGRFAAAVFLKHVELHRHQYSRTDQFPMYVVGEAEGFSVGEDGRPMLTPVVGGGHFHNSPDAPHAFVPKVGEKAGEDWEIAFIAITPRNLREDTQAVHSATKAAYTQVVGTEAPVRI